MTITKSAEENLWLIRLAEINIEYPDVIPEIVGKLIILKMHKKEPSSVIAGIMRALRDIQQDHDLYIQGMDLINKTYDNLFPGKPVKTSK
ncbi:hypothetical protein, partial [Desulfamplus magnetovallimortis]|uniref:hypothetical protein n=1 Tax=Desulfamplus magnetovallimortis TaxID=1246637 RepID=UPI00111B0D87